MKFRKKPVVIEAEQWQPEKHVDGVLVNCSEFPNPCGLTVPHVHTLEARSGSRPATGSSPG